MRAKYIKENFGNILQPKSEKEVENEANKLAPQELLKLAIENENKQLVKRALDNGANLNLPFMNHMKNQTPLVYTIAHSAYIMESNLDFIKYLFKIGSNKDQKNMLFWGLKLASLFGKDKIVNFLINNIKYSKSQLRKCLIAASFKKMRFMDLTLIKENTNHLGVIKLLVKAGVDPSYGLTGAIYGDGTGLKTLIKMGGDVNMEGFPKNYGNLLKKVLGFIDFTSGKLVDEQNDQSLMNAEILLSNGYNVTKDDMNFITYSVHIGLSNRSYPLPSDTINYETGEKFGPGFTTSGIEPSRKKKRKELIRALLNKYKN